MRKDGKRNAKQVNGLSNDGKDWVGGWAGDNYGERNVVSPVRGATM